MQEVVDPAHDPAVGPVVTEPTFRPKDLIFQRGMEQLPLIRAVVHRGRKPDLAHRGADVP
jgi:hypothetical protein